MKDNIIPFPKRDKPNYITTRKGKSESRCLIGGDGALHHQLNCCYTGYAFFLPKEAIENTPQDPQ